MKKELSHPIQVFNWKKDEFLLSYDAYPDKLKGWEISHDGDDKVMRTSH